MNSEHVVHLQRMANESWRGSSELAALVAAIVALSTQQSATCVGCEGNPAPENNPCAVCGQQPAADGGFTAADMMVARQEGRREARQDAAVDDAMVARAVAGYETGPWASFSPEESREAHRERMRAALQAALAQQPAAMDDVMDNLLTEDQRTELVEALVSDQVEGAGRVSLYLWEILEVGFKGFANYTDLELLDAHVSAFDEDFLDLESGEY